MNAQNVHGGSVLRTMLGLKLVEVTHRRTNVDTAVVPCYTDDTPGGSYCWKEVLSSHHIVDHQWSSPCGAAVNRTGEENVGVSSSEIIPYKIDSILISSHLRNSERSEVSSGKRRRYQKSRINSPRRPCDRCPTVRYLRHFNIA